LQDWIEKNALNLKFKKDFDRKKERLEGERKKENKQTDRQIDR
jgi:hypothetical protein